MQKNLVGNGRPIPILTYHQISPSPPKGTAFRSLCVSPESFSRQMAALKILGFKGLSMSQLQPYLDGRKTGRVVGITMDDGFLNNLNFALPVLKYHGFSATCYLVSRMLGQVNSWDHALGVPSSSLMSACEVRLWIAGGQEIGAHSRNHLDLTKLDENELEEQILGSRTDLESLFGCEVRHFCYPYGSFNLKAERCVRDAGYYTATTTQRGRVHGGLSSWISLPRIPVLRTTTLPVFMLKLMTSYEDSK